MNVSLLDHIPHGEVWFLPPALISPAPGETVEEWARRLIREARAGRVAIIKGLAGGWSSATETTP